MPHLTKARSQTSMRRRLLPSHQRAENFYTKLLLGGLFGFILLIAAIWGAHGGYVRWQQRRLIRSSVYALQHGDYRTASLAARNVLAINGRSAPAARVIAELAERGDDRGALFWRQRVVEFEPQSAEDALALARCALQFNELGTAERALASVNEASRQTAGYHAVAGLLAQARGENEKAQMEWSEAVRLEPENSNYRLHLGVIQNLSTDPNQRAAGETILNELRQDPKQRVAATRALITEGITRRESAGDLLQLARELQDYPEATINDRLLYLDFLHQLNDPQFSDYLTNLEKEAPQHLEDLATLLAWMSQHNLNILANDLIKTLPEETLRKWPLPMTIAEIDSRLADWQKLEAAIKGANWQGLEFLRYAYLARAMRGEDKPAGFEREWSNAVKAASDQPDSITTLIKIAAEWKWTREATDLLWSLAKFPEKQSQALQTLYQLYSSNGDTQGLFKVLLRLFQSGMDSSDLKNNLAQVELLLNANREDGWRLAAEVYRKAPMNPAYVTTYAYSLLTKGNPNGAVKVLESLTPEQLRDPSISVYYGICLAALHDPRAMEFLKAGEKARLLPEEKALVQNAFLRIQTPANADR